MVSIRAGRQASVLDCMRAFASVCSAANYDVTRVLLVGFLLKRARTSNKILLVFELPLSSILCGRGQ